MEIACYYQTCTRPMWRCRMGNNNQKKKEFKKQNKVAREKTRKSNWRLLTFVGISSRRRRLIPLVPLEETKGAKQICHIGKKHPDHVVEDDYYAQPLVGVVTITSALLQMHCTRAGFDKLQIYALFYIYLFCSALESFKKYNLCRVKQLCIALQPVSVHF